MRTRKDEPDDKPLLYTIAQVAEKLNCSRSFVYTLINRGLIRPLKIAPKCVRVSADELRRFTGGYEL